jgi:phosphopantothenoylcysteine decarboxylase/phosphopantothenate--cysteine ligase
MSDLILVYPCTANTIGKVANGIDDTPVTSILSVALGSRISIMIAPAMHKSMYSNPFIKENICRLKNQGIEFLEPLISEGKAKVARSDQVLNSILNKFKETRRNGVLLLAGKNVLVTAGSTIEYIDPIRVITNLSSGKMGNAIAEEAAKRSANVTIVCGHTTHDAFSSLTHNIIKVNTSDEMYNTVMSELSSKKYDIVILAAAVADFKLEEKKFTKKIDSRKDKLLLPLSSTKKIIDKVKQTSKTDTLLVAFKAEYRVSNSHIVNRAYEKLKECNGDLIVANDVGREGSEISSDNNEVFIVDRQKKVIHLPLQNKRDIARKLLDIIEKYLDNKEIKDIIQ